MAAEAAAVEWQNQTGQIMVNRLRFAVGDRVECNLGRGPNDWVPGTVLHRAVQLSHEGQVVPYQVMLDDGRLIFATMDINNVQTVNLACQSQDNI